jgi:hypothetical protein
MEGLRWELHNRRNSKIPVDKATGVSFGVFKATQHERVVIYWRGDDVLISRAFVSDHAKSVIAEMGYDPRYGARPLKRVLARELLHPLSRLVLERAVAAVSWQACLARCLVVVGDRLI